MDPAGTIPEFFYDLLSILLPGCYLTQCTTYLRHASAVCPSCRDDGPRRRKALESYVSRCRGGRAWRRRCGSWLLEDVLHSCK